MKENKWDKLNKQLDDALDAEFSSEETKQGSSMGKISRKQLYIGAYLDAAMKDHGLDYGLVYLDLLAKKEKEAKKSWKKYKQISKNYKSD